MIKKEDAVSPIIAVILMVAITVVLAGVAWLMVSGMIGSMEVPPTTINLMKEASTPTPGERIVHVAGVSQVYNLQKFEAALAINNTLDYNSAMDPVSNTTVGNVTFADANDDGKLNQGDYFIVSVVPGKNYKLKLFWKTSGSQITSTSWYEA